MYSDKGYVIQNLKELENKGYIRKENSKFRTIELLVDNEFDILDYLKRGGSGYKPETKGWDIAKEFLVREGIIEEKKILKKNKSQKKS